MPNRNGNAYGLTLLCPIRNGSDGGQSLAGLTRRHLQNLPTDENSPMAQVPNTYLCRFYVLNDVFFEGGPQMGKPKAYLQELKAAPAETLLGSVRDLFQIAVTGFRRTAEEEHLKSSYLVFSCNFHGELDSYLTQMWQLAEAEVREIWRHCVAFDEVSDGTKFVSYIKRCQVENQLFFNGSTDDSLAEQLKSLYLKQEFSRFAFANQQPQTPEGAAALQRAFTEFVARTRPADLTGPTWKPGAAREQVI